MSNLVKVSVIIPAYNVESYIGQCLDSLLNQTLKDIEIICVDDGSTDRTRTILEAYAIQDPRVIVKSQNHKNAGAARNFGLQIACGEYLSFLDSDDFFEPKMLETCADLMDKEQSDIVVYKARRYNQKNGEVTDMLGSIRDIYCPEESPFSPFDISEHIFSVFQIAPWNKMFRHSFVKKSKLLFQEIPRANDVAFSLQAITLANKISFVKTVFANYRVSSGTSLQQTNDKTPLAFWEALLEAKRRLISSNVYDSFEQSFLNIALEIMIYNLKSVKSTVAYRDILAYIKYYAEKEFGFMTKNISYYYKLNELSEYCKIINKVNLVNVPIATPKVSVVIPVLNSRNYIRECIETVLEQTLRDIEIICVDAGSTDGTLEILKEYEALDKRVIIMYSEKKSYGYQVNLGIKKATGTYLAIVESDDYIHPEFLQTLYQIAEENMVEVLKADYHIYMGEANKYRYAYRKIISDDCNYNKLMNPSENITAFEGKNVPWSGLYSLKFLKENDILLNETEGASYQNNGLWFQCMVLARRVYFCNRSFYRFRIDNLNSSIYSKDNVYCMCDEYDFIRTWLSKDKEKEKKFAPLCAYYRFEKYLWTLNRIGEAHKKDFLRKFSDDFRKIEAIGELDYSLYSKEQSEKLQKIMYNTNDFYEHDLKPSKGFKPLKSDTELLKETVQALTMESNKNKLALANSKSELSGIKNELGKTKTELGKTQNELGKTKTELGKTQNELGKMKTELSKTQNELGKTKTELSKTQNELGKTKTKLGKTQNELGKTKTELGKIKNSKAYRVGEKLAWPVRKLRKLRKS